MKKVYRSADEVFQKLRASGYRTTIYHERYWMDGAKNILGPDKICDIQEEMNELGITSGGVYGKGGFTCAEIRTPDGEEFVAYAECSLKDNFCKRTGRQIAINRLLKTMLEEGYNYSQDL